MTNGDKKEKKPQDVTEKQNFRPAKSFNEFDHDTLMAFVELQIHTTLVAVADAINGAISELLKNKHFYEVTERGIEIHSFEEEVNKAWKV